MVSEIQCFSQTQYTGPPPTSVTNNVVTATSIVVGNVVATGNIRTTTNLFAGNIMFNTILTSYATDALANAAGIPLGGIYANVGALQIRRAG